MQHLLRSVPEAEDAQRELLEFFDEHIETSKPNKEGASDAARRRLWPSTSGLERFQAQPEWGIRVYWLPMENRLV